jgi:hypothetical protein
MSTTKAQREALARSRATEAIDDSERAQILGALDAWIRQRPGFDPANYDRAGYVADTRRVARQLQHARLLLAQVRWRQSIDADALKEGFRAFSGRLSWDGKRLDYCTGQYWCTEYRAAACAVLASVLWNYWREVYAASRKGQTFATPEETEYSGAREDIQRKARQQFGRAIAKEWFD